MSDEFLTKQEAAALMGMHPESLGKYTSGTRTPALKAKRVIVKGKKHGSQVKLLIRRTDFEAWRVEYEAKRPFGSKLHKSKETVFNTCSKCGSHEVSIQEWGDTEYEGGIMRICKTCGSTVQLADSDIEAAQAAGAVIGSNEGTKMGQIPDLSE